MLLLLIPLLAQVVPPTERQILEAEYARAENVSVLIDGTRSPNARIQRLAVRAIGRLERPALRSAVAPLLRAVDPEVRREAVNALGQMAATGDVLVLLPGEPDARVRSAVYETIGRAPPMLVNATTNPPAADALSPVEALLITGLADTDGEARTGAARGLEALIRKFGRTARPHVNTVTALRQAIRDNPGEELRELALLALTAAGDRDSLTLAMTRSDPSPQVRRLAVALSRQWLDDPSPMVRVQALRSAGTCGRAVNAVDDVSEMVVLTAVDFLGERKCDASVIESVVNRGRSWRVRAHALVSLARVAPDVARRMLPSFVSSKDWHERVYAATAAKILGHEATLAQLARDAQPNVAIEAMSTAADAVRALSGTHSGLLLAAAEKLKGTPELPAAVPTLLDALDRESRSSRVTQRVTHRDPRVAILERLREAADARAVERLRTLLADPDPRVASLAAQVISEKSGSVVSATTTRYVPAPLPPDATIRALDGATAVVRMKGLGTITIELLNDDAPVTVATFARLAEGGKMKGLTFHRIVANFVVQGASPGADEYDALTDTFMRDELGFARNLRGTFGISTRGRDTGDGQIFINLVDNFRLDHDYTVFARVTTGLDVIDRIQEGDVIESVDIVRRRSSNNR